MLSSDLVFPDEEWIQREPSTLGVNAARLREFADAVGGDGVVIRNGYLIHSWCDAKRRSDWASAAKPVLSTLLLFAVHENRLASVDEPIRPWVRRKWPGKDLIDKDRVLTFRHLANMTSGYARGEPPGERWAYNDYAINLYQHLLVAVYDESLNNVALSRFKPLQFQDGDLFGSRGGGGVNTSPRDFARLGWFWLNKGRWNGKQLLPETLLEVALKPQVSPDLPRTEAAGEDYLDIGTYGGGTDQEFPGQGVYGFNWWFNAPVPGSAKHLFSHLPPDTFAAIGHVGKEVMVAIPSERVVVAARGDWGGLRLEHTQLLIRALK